MYQFNCYLAVQVKKSQRLGQEFVKVEGLGIQMAPVKWKPSPIPHTSRANMSLVACRGFDQRDNHIVTPVLVRVHGSIRLCCWQCAMDQAHQRLQFPEILPPVSNVRHPTSLRSQCMSTTGRQERSGTGWCRYTCSNVSAKMWYCHRKERIGPNTLGGAGKLGGATR